uniref:CCHC-type domain-containing protein n=1 Tax=Tanacetum cinerariifolium TaxID=118510 RepID=A0A6L2ME87_TANCI|nr:hypothetical protein [Tanacetum cinerariifolium]
MIPGSIPQRGGSRTYNKDLGCVWLARISFRGGRLVISSADLGVFGCAVLPVEYVWFMYTPTRVRLVDRFAPRYFAATHIFGGVTAKYFKKIYKPANNNLRTSLNLRNKNLDATLRYKNDNQSGQFGNQRTMNVVRARENVGSPVVQQSGIQCFNCKEFSHFAKECTKPKKELEAHYSYMVKIQEVPTADLNTDSEPLEQNDQNNVESNDERVALANLIANLKLDKQKDSKAIKERKHNTCSGIERVQNYSCGN